MAMRRQTAIRAGLVLVGAAILLVAVPRWLDDDKEPAASVLHGTASGDRIDYVAAQLADILADIEHQTGFRAVAFPVIGARRFSGSLVVGRDPSSGKAAVAQLARTMGLELRQAGPHWALVDPAVPSPPLQNRPGSSR